jgi:hypothetical protein
MKSIPSPDYWISNPELKKTYLTKEEIASLNELNFEHDPNLNDLTALPTEMDKNKIHSAIQAYDLNKLTSYYDTNGMHLTEQYASELLELMNLNSIKSLTSLKYGIAIERCNLRSFPTNFIALNEDLDEELDRFQETAIYPLEPMVILHVSSDEYWYFVQTYNYRGWLHKSSIALLVRDEFLSCFSPKDFLYVTQDFVEIQMTNNRSVKFIVQMPMGSRIPKYLLTNKINDISIQCDLNQKGLSPEPMEFSRANILRLALQCLYDPYDWGGKIGYRDCASLVTDVFRCFGITMPRNANQQANYSYGVHCEWLKNSKEQVLSILKPGSLIFIPGHVMIYLGSFVKVPYVIHSVKEFYTSMDGTMEKSSLSGVQITPLNIYRKNWDSYISSIYSILDLYINEWCWPIL